MDRELLYQVRRIEDRLGPLGTVGLDELAKEILRQLQSVPGYFKGIKIFKEPAKTYQAIVIVIAIIEKLAEKVQGIDKKKLAVAVLDKLIKVPFWFPKPLKRVLLSCAIDLLITGLNKLIGKRWITL